MYNILFSYLKHSCKLQNWSLVPFQKDIPATPNYLVGGETDPPELPVPTPMLWLGCFSPQQHRKLPGKDV